MHLRFNNNSYTPCVVAGGLLTAAHVKGDLSVSVTWGKETMLKGQKGASFDTSSSISRYLARLASTQQLYGASDLDQVEVGTFFKIAYRRPTCVNLSASNYFSGRSSPIILDIKFQLHIILLSIIFFFSKSFNLIGPISKAIILLLEGLMCVQTEISVSFQPLSWGHKVQVKLGPN